MQETTSREKILKKIRRALIKHRPKPFDGIDWESSIHEQSHASLEETFAHSFAAIGGHFVFCENENDFLDNFTAISAKEKWDPIICAEPALTALLEKKSIHYQLSTVNYPEGMAGVISCEALVARLGVVLTASNTESGRRLAVVPTISVIVAYTSQLVYDLKDAFSRIKEKYGDRLPSQIVSIAGPSRTADIEKTLVTPAHGPRDIFVFLIDDSNG